ncbi:MAG: type II toxin-antitoxin system RelE/ParE family toxin [Chloroflexota bacterium]
MPLYEIVFARSARKELQALSHAVAKRILKKVELLASSPRPSGCKKLRGHSNLWRIRVGEYRIIYDIDDDSRVVDISVVRHRSETYR